MAGLLLTTDPPVGARPTPPDLSGLTRREEPVLWLWVLVLDAQTLAVAESDGSAAALAALATSGRTWVH